MPTSSEAKATDDPSYRPPGLVALLSALSEAPLVQSAGYVTTTPTITYTYDPLSRLTGASYSTGEQFEYAYDGVGNRTAYTVTLGSTTVTTYTYDAANRLTSVGDVAYTWDARGNLTNDGTFTYTYNAAGRLVGAQSITATLVYTYNADGLRVAQQVSGTLTTFAWDLALPLAQVLATGDGVLDAYGVGRIAEVRGGQWAYPLPDALGSVRQWVDGQGYVTYAAGYAPYGEELWQAGSTESAWGFTGEWWDANVGLECLRARWYAPYLNRFTSPDPIVPDFRNPQSVNGYVYVLDNPVNATDPTGHCPNDPKIKSGDYSYSCNCGWIDWGHASPREAKGILRRVFTELDDPCSYANPMCSPLSPYSPDYKAIGVRMRDVAGGVWEYAVVRRNLSAQEKREITLGIFKELTVEFETYQGTAWFGAEEALTHSSFSEEDLPSNLMGFYVALQLAKDPEIMQDFRRISGPELQVMIRPLCGIPRIPGIDDNSVERVFSTAVWERGGFDGGHYECQKNCSWAPRLARSCVIDGWCGLNRRWPSQFSALQSESSLVGGKWWWYRGQTVDGGLVPSGVADVYYLWPGVASAPPTPISTTPTP